MIKAYKYKMKPTEAQKAFFAKCFGCCRFVYNHALKERIDAYSYERKSLSFFDQCASLRRIKKQPEYTWLNEVPALSLNYALLNLNNAYNHFFKTKAGFPKYKSKKDRHDSVKFEPNTTRYDFENNKVRIPKLGWVKICQNRTFDSKSVKINSTTVSRDACGTYWCTVSVNVGKALSPKAKVEKGTAVGIDVGISDFAVLSDGTRLHNMHFSEQREKQIVKAQRCMARKRRSIKDAPASRRYERYRTKLARLHRSINNCRADYLQKASTAIVKRHNTICIEDLNVKGMMQNHHLAGAISSVAWSEFIRMLEYKSEWYGVNLLKAGRFDPTSQTCSVCGYRNSGTKDLSVREWKCPKCGTYHDRDVNAARNIMSVAIENYFKQQSPAVTGITDADGADSESNVETCSPVCNYASDETSMQNEI